MPQPTASRDEQLRCLEDDIEDARKTLRAAESRLWDLLEERAAIRRAEERQARGAS